MNKTFKILVGSLVLGGVLLVPFWTQAKPVDPATDPFGVAQTAQQAGLPDAVAGERDVPSVIGSVVAAGLALVGIVFFILILYAGFTWMTARGDSSKIDRAKGIIEDAVIGMLLVSAAYAIANFMFGTIAGGGKCAAVGGVCMKATECTSARTEDNLCPGDNTIKCCLP